MSRKINALSVGIFSLLGFLPLAIGAGSQRVGQWDFSYLTSGAIRATPVQVFDNGSTTYFQFRAGEAIPAIFQNKDGQVTLMVPTHEGPYIKVNEVGGHFTLQLGRSQAMVVYANTGRQGVPLINAVESNGMKSAYSGGGYPQDRSIKLVASLGRALSHMGSDALEANSYATPIKGDAVTWQDGTTEQVDHKILFPSGSQKLGPVAANEIKRMAQSLKQATRITIVGRDDETYKEGLDKARAEAIRDFMVKAGIPIDRITLKTGVQGIPKDNLWPSDIRVETVRPTLIARPSPRPDLSIASTTRAAPVPTAAAWMVLKSDLNVKNMLIRWGESSGWRVIWKDGPEVLITDDAKRPLTQPDFFQAADFVITQAKAAGYKINAESYSNQVLVITGE